MRRSSDERIVLFRFRPTRPTQGVEVRGEMTHWKETVAMQPVGDGWLEAALPVPDGTYGYKFRTAEGDWFLDPDNPRTSSWGGARNSLLSVNGAEEPVIHAPCRPDVYVEDDGRLRVGARLRRAAGDGLWVRWNEGHGWHEWPMESLGAEDEHLLFAVHLPITARELTYLFVMADGRCIGRMGGAGQAFRVVRTDITPAVPDWWRDAVLYTILVDRFRRGRQQGQWDERASRLKGPARAGGDLDGVREAIPYLADIGVTALHLTPVHFAPSAHRYDVVDPRVVDPDVGGEPALRHLIDAAHGRGIRILADLTITHVHRAFFAFKDVLAKGAQSPYWDWFFC